MSIPRYHFDAIVIGAGGAGMRAALTLAELGVRVALISKVFPTRSHTVSAQGGITCALGNADPEDDWRWHMYDTIKGSDYLGDQDAIEYMCEAGPQAVYELEHMGLPFSRMDNGKIYQRPFGGQSKNFGGAQAARTCAAADRTGHAMLHTLYQHIVRLDVAVFSEWYAIDLLWNTDHSVCCGAFVMSIETGEYAIFQSSSVILATGGAGRIYQSTTNALINTGDGLGMALRAGLWAQDMEMWQFHPTGIAGSGVLVTEGCRGEGGFLTNAKGDRFMERYAPSVKDLASRDVVSRSIAIEIREGRGFTNSHGVGYVHLNLQHLGEDIIKSRLPGIRELSMTFAGVDPIQTPIPIVPTCHYMMGGIPTNIHGQALNQQQQPIPGLYAVGECACVSVHGANRLGGNSLLDLIVFGRSAGLHVHQMMRSGQFAQEMIDPVSIEKAEARMNLPAQNSASIPVSSLKAQMQKVMQESFGVFRNEADMMQGIEQLKSIKAQSKSIGIRDTNHVFNTERIEALEFLNLLEVAWVTAISAIERKESRGAHARSDYPNREDSAENLSHIMSHAYEPIFRRPVNFKPQSMQPFLPKERVY